MAYLTLLDWGRRVDPDGNIADIAELLSQCNEIFDDMLWREGNLPTGHKTTVRTGLPQATFRMLYQGVPYTKSTTAQVTEAVAELVAYSQIDKSLADLDGNTMALRMSEDNAHLEGMSQQVAGTMFYGNQSVSPTQFTGFAPRFNTTSTGTAQNAVNVMDAGGTGSSNTSIWIVGWGDRTVYGLFPKGSKAGLQMEDKGDTVPGFDSNMQRFEAYTTHFVWKLGLCVEDWRYVVRIANIDTTSAAGGLASSTPPDLFALIAKSYLRFPTMNKRQSGITKTDAPDDYAPGINPAIYVNRTVREYMDIQAIRDKNVLLGMRDYAGTPITEYRGVPIKVNDQLLNTEARVV